MKIKYYLCGDEKPVSQYPLGLGYLLSNAKGYDAEIVEHPADLRGADVIGLSTLTDGLKEAVKVARMFPNYPIIVGGQGTLWPGIDGLVRGDDDRPAFDIIIQGEGENMMNYLPSVGITVNEGQFSNEPAPLPIDSILPPERGRCKDVVPILTSRGCPHNCSFCSSQAYWGQPRYHSAGYVIDEVLYLGKRYPHCCRLEIMDDSFISHKDRFEELFNWWMTKNLNHRWRLQGFVRSTDITFRVAKMLKHMGFTSVRFGAETVSDKLLKGIGKTTTQASYQQCIDACNKVDLPVTMSLMQYMPGETSEDRRLTANFLLKNRGKVSVEGFYRFRPYPGTKYYNGEDVLSGDWRVRG